MKERLKAPELRFSGFTDDWELRKLGELTKEFKSGSSIKAENIFETGTFPVYGGNGVRGYTDTFNHDGNYALIGRQGALSGNMNFSVGKAYFTEHAVAVKANEANDTRFLYFLMDKSKLGRWVTQSAQPGLAVGTLIEIKTLVPNNFEEQKKIGSFFKQLDNTIALHQRKLDLLKEWKKGYLQKMFPKTGIKVPELRFEGFIDAWEECKLGNILKEFSIKSKTEDEHRVLSSTNSGMEFREGRVSGTSNLGYKIIKNGDLVLSPQNLWLGNININNIGEGLVSPSYKTFKFINIDSSFINPQLRTKKMLEEYKNSSTQGASVVRRNLEIASFFQIKISVPTILEQEKIGAFFKQLDNTITLHQRKLDLLKEQKKGYLQKMFV